MWWKIGWALRSFVSAGEWRLACPECPWYQISSAKHLLSQGPHEASWEEIKWHRGIKQTFLGHLYSALSCWIALHSLLLASCCYQVLASVGVQNTFKLNCHRNNTLQRLAWSGLKEMPGVRHVVRHSLNCSFKRTCYKKGWRRFITTFFEGYWGTNHRQSWCHAGLCSGKKKKKKSYLWHFEKFQLLKKGHTGSSAVNMWFFSVPPEKNIFVLFLPDEQRLQPWVKKYFTSSVSSFHQSHLFIEISSLCSERSCNEKGSSVLPKEDGRETDRVEDVEMSTVNVRAHQSQNAFLPPL